MDFDDLLLNLNRLLEDNPHIRESIADRFMHVLVDEFQDTNRLQADLIDLLSSVHGNLVVVGTAWNWDKGGRYAAMRLYHPVGELLDVREYRYQGGETLATDLSVGLDVHIYLGAFTPDGLMLVVESSW